MDLWKHCTFVGDTNHNHYYLRMPSNKNAQFRYQILDRCFSDFRHKYEFTELLDKVNDYLEQFGYSDQLIY